MEFLRQIRSVKINDITSPVSLNLVSILQESIMTEFEIKRRQRYHFFHIVFFSRRTIISISNIYTEIY